jgi:hypothetical protein
MYLGLRCLRSMEYFYADFFFLIAAIHVNVSAYESQRVTFSYSLTYL